MEKRGQLNTPATLASGKNTPLPSQLGRGVTFCLEPGTALDAVEKTSFVPVKNRTMSSRTPVPKPSHYTDQKIPTQPTVCGELNLLQFLL